MTASARSAVLGLLTMAAVTVSAQPPPPAITAPLPAYERLKPQRPLSATLQVSAETIAVDEPLRFTLRLTNTGTRRLHLNPQIASNLRLFDAAGRLVEAPSAGIVDYWRRSIAPEAFITLEPGQTHQFAVTAGYHASPDRSDYRNYSVHSTSGGDAAVLHLPPGRYSARFTYINYPDYGPWEYDLEATPGDVWEGRIETPPVRFTVEPLADARVQVLLGEIAQTAPTAQAIALVGRGRVSAATEALVNRFQRSPLDRTSIVNAVRLLGGDAVPRLLTEIDALPARDRDEVVMTREFATLARDATQCAGVPLLLGALYSTRGDVVSLLGETFLSLAPACPRVTSALRALLQSADQPPADDWGRTASRRGHAAELLGVIGNKTDVPLLVAALRGELPMSPPPWVGSDPARSGAVRALARLGGTEAANALLEQLADETGSRFIMPDLVAATGKLRPPGMNAAFARLMASSASSPTLLVGILIEVRQRPDASLVPSLRSLLKHRDRGVRSYALSALAEAGGRSVNGDMLAALEDTRAEGQATALFHLARHGDAALLPLFVNRLMSPQQYVREAANEGITRFGTADSFTTLRAALDTASEQVRPYVAQALQFLTFAVIDPRDKAEQLDAWWSTHRQGTRLDWAREALNGPSGPLDRAYVIGGAPMLAWLYLTSLPSPPPDLVERALQHRDWRIRIATAEHIAPTDRSRAVALLIAELENRQQNACWRAVRQLTALTGPSDRFDCTDAVGRQQAVQRWASRLRP